jgi:hypothetical protein
MGAGDLSLLHPDDVFSGAVDTHAAQRNSAALTDMIRAITFPKAAESGERQFLAL